MDRQGEKQEQRGGGKGKEDRGAVAKTTWLKREENKSTVGSAVFSEITFIPYNHTSRQATRTARKTSNDTLPL